VSKVVVRQDALGQRVVASLIVVLAALLGSRVGADAAASRAQAAVCPRLSEAASLPLRPGGGRLRGDVDGDGHPDAISVRYAPQARASCGFLLVARTRSQLLSVRVPQWYKTEDLRISDWSFPEPFLAAVVQLDSHRSQIVVARWHGAATASVSLYGVVEGRLAVLPFHPRLYEDQLVLFGTINTGDTNVRCVRGGPLVLLSKGPTSDSGKRWFVSRSEYHLVRGRFLRTRTHVVRSSRKSAYALARRWGMGGLPFAGCTVARGRRL
jgi:hypothetical protein